MTQSESAPSGPSHRPGWQTYGVDRADRVANGALDVSAGFFTQRMQFRGSGAFNASKMRKMSNALARAFAEFAHDIIGVVAVPDSVLAAQEHLGGSF